MRYKSYLIVLPPVYSLRTGETRGCRSEVTRMRAGRAGVRGGREARREEKERGMRAGRINFDGVIHVQDGTIYNRKTMWLM